MKFLDLLSMSIENLWKRKVRTFLTILGVIIGSASIIVMLSLGLGLSKTRMDQVKKQGGLTSINVYGGLEGQMFYSSDSIALEEGYSSEPQEQLKLDEASLEMFANLPHVQFVSPVLSLGVLAKQGAYEGYLDIRGMSVEALEKLNIPLAKGRLPISGNTEIEMVIGNQVLQNFYNPKNHQSYWETGVLPEVDFLNKPLFVIFDMDEYYNSQSGSGKMPKKYLINSCGLVEGGIEDYNQFSYSVLVDIEALKLQLQRIFKNKPIPGQPMTPTGKPYKEMIYSEAYVQVSEMERVKEVQKQIMEMGFQASSNIEFLDYIEEEAKIIQAVLGGIGGVSLFVAAIGIANTMMMSIYERTKEIGIIKVLGCSLSDIRTLFLLEAGFIGLIGGVLGIGLSYGISSILNLLLGGMSGYGPEATISYIPLWLVLLSLVFSVFVGMVAGFFPALRAMKLSPLEAIRSQ